MIFMWFLARNSRGTGPKMRVPIGSFWALMSTAAFLSKRITEPSGRRMSLAVRTTTAFMTSPFFTRPRGIASLTETTMMSPTDAYLRLEPPRTLMHITRRAPELSATSRFVCIWIMALILSLFQTGFRRAPLPGRTTPDGDLASPALDLARPRSRVPVPGYRTSTELDAPGHESWGDCGPIDHHPPKLNPCLGSGERDTPTPNPVPGPDRGSPQTEPPFRDRPGGHAPNSTPSRVRREGDGPKPEPRLGAREAAPQTQAPASEPDGDMALPFSRTEARCRPGAPRPLQADERLDLVDEAGALAFGRADEDPLLELRDRPRLLDEHRIAHLGGVVLVVGVVVLRPAHGLLEDRVRETALGLHDDRLVLLVADHDALQKALWHLLFLKP